MRALERAALPVEVPLLEDRAQVQRLRDRSRGQVESITVPFFDQDIYDVSGLSQMVRYLAGDGAPAGDGAAVSG